MIDIWTGWMYAKISSYRYITVGRSTCQKKGSGSHEVTYVNTDGGGGSVRFTPASLPVRSEDPVGGGGGVVLEESQFETNGLFQVQKQFTPAPTPSTPTSIPLAYTLWRWFVLIFRASPEVRAPPSNGPPVSSSQADGHAKLSGVAARMREEYRINTTWLMIFKELQALSRIICVLLSLHYHSHPISISTWFNLKIPFHMNSRDSGTGIRKDLKQKLLETCRYKITNWTQTVQASSLIKIICIPKS